MSIIKHPIINIIITSILYFMFILYVSSKRILLFIWCTCIKVHLNFVNGSVLWITMKHQWRIQVLRLGGGGGHTFYRILNCTPPPPPLSIFPEATMKIYTWIVLGFWLAPPMTIFSEATIKAYAPWNKGGGGCTTPPPPPGSATGHTRYFVLIIHIKSASNTACTRYLKSMSLAAH